MVKIRATANCRLLPKWPATSPTTIQLPDSTETNFEITNASISLHYQTAGALHRIDWSLVTSLGTMVDLWLQTNHGWGTKYTALCSTPPKISCSNLIVHVFGNRSPVSSRLRDPQVVWILGAITLSQPTILVWATGTHRITELSHVMNHTLFLLFFYFWQIVFAVYYVTDGRWSVQGIVPPRYIHQEI